MAAKKSKYPNMTATTIFKNQERDGFNTDRSISVNKIAPLVTPHSYGEAKQVTGSSKNMLKQEPAGVVVLKQKYQKSPKTKNSIVYYSSEDEESGEIKKVYSNVSVIFKKKTYF